MYIKKTEEVKNNIGLIVANFGVEIGFECNKKKFNKALDKCMQRIHKYIFPYKIK